MEYERITESCGCEFVTAIYDNSASTTHLDKCRCQKHYDEQFFVEIDGKKVHYEPENVVPLEVQK
jgi:hypothetical protein